MVVIKRKACIVDKGLYVRRLIDDDDQFKEEHKNKVIFHCSKTITLKVESFARINAIFSDRFFFRYIFRERLLKYDYAGINFRERPKNSRNRGTFYPRNFLPLKSFYSGGDEL